MEKYKFNFVNNSIDLREEEILGVTYKVAPVVVVLEKVLGNELLPAQEIEKYPKSWNGRPVVFDHPSENGGSATSPGILRIGYMYNTRFDNSEKALKSEVWMPEELISKNGVKSQILLQKINEKEPVEVSSAYWADRDQTDGIFNGDKYYAIQKNLRPDHLAILLDGEGKCNLDDGCGLPRNSNSINQNEEQGEDIMDEKNNKSLMKHIQSFFKNEDTVFEKIGLDAETLEAISDAGVDTEQLKDKIQALTEQDETIEEEEGTESNPEEEESTESNPEEEETPEDNEESASEENPACEELDKHVANVGGVENALAILSNHISDVEALREKILENQILDVTEEGLEQLSVKALEKLAALPSDQADFTALGINEDSTSGDQASAKPPKVLLD